MALRLSDTRCSREGACIRIIQLKLTAGRLSPEKKASVRSLTAC